MSSLNTISLKRLIPPTIPTPYCVTQPISSSRRPRGLKPSSSTYFSKIFCCFSFSFSAHCALQKPKPKIPETELSWRRRQPRRLHGTAPCSKASLRETRSCSRKASNACSRKALRSPFSTISFVRLERARELACCRMCSMSAIASATASPFSSSGSAATPCWARLRAVNKPSVSGRERLTWRFRRSLTSAAPPPDDFGRGITL
mmetsp:Transcript_57609/g.135039  ORF Transcript_57609/g.135039 Transcript_57609/m.135039 type:complete len:203 (-) Transcript_57609:51-659(-)